MNNAKIKTYSLNISEDGVSDFKCTLVDGRIVSIEMPDFYESLIKIDTSLELHSLMFGEWEDLTKELEEIGYDFITRLTEYVQQWTEKQLANFASTLDHTEQHNDEEDFEVIDEEEIDG